MGGRDEGPIRVLIVDDSDDIRLLASIVLESSRAFELWGEAANGAEAVALVTKEAPDAIVLDIMMPVMDGMTALPLLRDLCPDTPILIMAAAASPQLRSEALALGAAAVLDKAAGLRQLPVAILAAVQHRIPA